MGVLITVAARIYLKEKYAFFNTKVVTVLQCETNSGIVHVQYYVLLDGHLRKNQ